MTRSDYLKLAEALEKARRFLNKSPHNRNQGGTHMETKAFLLGVDVAARYIADAIAKGNPKFDFDQFVRNAGAGPVTIASTLN